MIASTALSIAADVRAGRRRAVDVVEAHLSRIVALQPVLNCFTTVTAARARARAAAIDADVAAGRPVGPLAGVPFAVKDLFDVQGVVTLAGSRILADQPPAARDATLVARVEAAGGVLLGALTMDEFAYGFTTENAHHGNTRNPHDVTRSAGGSSGGCGAAVAAGLAALALGSDTNGSIRVPSSLCGLFGLKPTYGRLPRTGSFPFVASLDHLGPFARTVVDLAACYDVLQGPDPADPAQASRPVEPVSAALAGGASGLRIAVAGGHFEHYTTACARGALAVAATALGATRRVELPEAGRARNAAFVLTMAEAAQLHRPWLRERPMDYDPATRDRLLAGALVPAATLLQAQRFRAWFRSQVLSLFDHVDAILAPATPSEAPRLGQATASLAGQQVPVRPTLGILTQPLSFIGLPVVAVPVRPDLRGARLPLGVQVIAAPWREDVALRIAAALEAAGVAAAPVVTPAAADPGATAAPAAVPA